MKRAAQVLSAAVLLCLPVLSGCGLFIYPDLVAADELTGVAAFDPNDYGFSINFQKIESEDPQAQNYVLDFEGEDIFKVHQALPVTADYVRFAKSAETKGRIGKRTYRVLFDSGNSILPHITPAHIVENQLPVYSVAISPRDEQVWNFGIALIDELNIAGLSITQLPATYNLTYTSYQLFGLGFAEVGKDKTINLSLSVMQEFSYIAFDSRDKKMRLSLDEPFVPDTPADWKSYPFIATDDNRLFIHSTLEGVPVTLMIDTGSETQLLLTKSCFDRLAESQPNLNYGWKFDRSGFAPLAGGYFPVQSRTIRGLTFDRSTYKGSTNVGIVDDGLIDDFLDENQFDGLIGFPFFDETVMVLDFENNLLWVKKAKGSRFER
jgi:hypothetical protein